MSTEVVQAGNDFVIIADDRNFGGVRTEAFKIDGKTGVVTAGGAVVGPSELLVVTQAGKNLSGSLTLAGAVVGDKVVSVTNLSVPGNGAANFESKITVAGHIQQSLNTDQSAVIYQFILRHKA
jgi:hypothetical protein